MSAHVIGVSDGGTTSIKDRFGNPMTVGVFIFQVVVQEAKPEEVIAFCNLAYKDTIKKNLQRLLWVKPALPAPPETPTPLNQTKEEQSHDREQ